MVLYLIFAGGLISGSFFPNFACTQGENKCISFGSLFYSWQPADAGSYAKVLVWSFIAGFAERLVPSTLDSLGEALTKAGKPP